MPVTRPEIPYSGVPTVEAQGGGGDTSGVRATPESFGAGVAQSVGQAGQEGFDVSQHYAQMATEAHVNDIIANQFAPAAAKLSADFYSKQGKDAVMAEPAYIQSLTNLRGQFLKDQSPLATQLLGNYMTRHAAQETDGAARHAAQQQTVYEDTSNKALVDTLSDNAVSNFNNPDLVASTFKQMDGQISKHGMDRGQSDEEIAETQRNAHGVTVNAMVGRAIAAGDVATANQIYSQNKQYVPGHQQLEIDKMLHGENMRQMGNANATALLSGKPLPATGVGHSAPEVQATVASAAKNVGLDPNDALATASIESGFGQNVGKRGDIGQTGKGGDLQEQAANLAAEKKKSNSIAANALGRPAEPWEGYICYQQGAGGGPALLKAAADNPTARAVDVLRPLYGSNKEALSAIQDNGGNASMTSGQFLAFVKQNYQAHATRSGCAIPQMDATLGQNMAATPESTGLTPAPTVATANAPNSLHEAILAPTKDSGVALQQGATPVQSLMEFDKIYPDAIAKANQIPNLDQREATLKSLEQNHSVYQQAASAYKTNLLNQVAQIANDPKFTSMDDPRITSEMRAAITTDSPYSMNVLEAASKRNANKSSGVNTKDMREYGSGFYDLFKGTHDGSVTIEDLQKHVGKNGDITMAGYDKLVGEMSDKKNPESEAEGKMKAAVFAAAKDTIYDKQAWPDAIGAMYKLDDELKEKKIPASDRYSGADNKNSILHALDPVVNAQQTPQAIADALSKVTEAKPGVFTSVVGPHAPERADRRELINDFQSGKYTADKEKGEQALRKAYADGIIDDDLAKNMAVAYGYASASKHTP